MAEIEKRYLQKGEGRHYAASLHLYSYKRVLYKPSTDGNNHRNLFGFAYFSRNAVSVFLAAGKGRTDSETGKQNLYH
jgi:hypothetical protein